MNEYCPAYVGSWIRYQVFEISGQWHGGLFSISVENRKPHYNSPQTIRVEAGDCKPCLGTAELKRLVYTGKNGIDGGSLVDGPWYGHAGEDYIGEAVNDKGAVHTPYIPKLARYPYTGQKISGYTDVIPSCRSSNEYGSKKHYWEYKTIRWYDYWGGHADCWRTGLAELQTERRYNYIFKRGVGMVHFWFIGPDDTGLEYYAFDWSVQ